VQNSRTAQADGMRLMFPSAFRFQID